MKRLMLFAGLVLGIIIFISPVQASFIHDINISGLPSPSGVEAFNVWYDVSPDFALIGPVKVEGSGIPVKVTLGWAQDSSSVVIPLFKLAVSNMDGWALGIENNLLNGTIATFEYEGSILGVNFFQFGDFTGNEIQSISLASWDQTSTNFVVPIPSALFLLGSGLVGLVAVRRKRD